MSGRWKAATVPAEPDRRLFRRRPADPAAGLGPLFAMAEEGLAVLGPDGRVLAANPALRRLAGPGVELRPGTPAAWLLAGAARPALERLLANASAGHPAAPMAAAPADPAAPADAEWSIAAEALGEDGRLLLRITDRTLLRRLEARLDEASRMETIGRLAGGIAHDFNNLLGIILGAAGALRAVGIAAEAAAELAEVEAAARRGSALITQLLAFARQQRLRPRVIALNAAVTDLAPLLRRLLGERIRLELRLEEPGRRIRMDPAQLDQVLLNLAANAREAMAEGGRLTIATGHAVLLRPEGEGPSPLPPGRYVVLEVADSGRGIAPEALPRIFEPFFTTRPDKGGTGLGLATVQGIIAQSGGHIGVTSVPGQGACFRILLPREAAAAEDATAPEPASAHAAAPARVLLVEDEAPLRRLGEQILRRAGHQVVTADSAEAALDLLASGQAPAILVSDVAMPGIDGVELARRCRARWPHLPVLLLSGYAEATLHVDLEA